MVPIGIACSLMSINRLVWNISRSSKLTLGDVRTMPFFSSSTMTFAFGCVVEMNEVGLMLTATQIKARNIKDSVICIGFPILFGTLRMYLSHAPPRFPRFLALLSPCCHLLTPYLLARARLPMSFLSYIAYYSFHTGLLSLSILLYSYIRA